MSDQPPVPVHFLLANWFSGATLLTLLLNRHPEVATNGELFPGDPDGEVRNVLCSCGDPINTCRFYRQAAAHMWSGAGYDPAVFRWLPRYSNVRWVQKGLITTRSVGGWKLRVRQAIPGFRRQAQQFVLAHERLMWKALELLGGTAYLDGSKSIARAELFMSQPDYEAGSLILLVRDPLSWSASLMSRRPYASKEYAARSWTEYIRGALRLTKAFRRSRLHIVRYEELCTDPASRLADVFHFMGLKHDPRVVSPDGEPEHHVLGNAMRTNFDGRVRRPTDRAMELSREDRTWITNACREVMDIVGYADRAGEG